MDYDTSFAAIDSSSSTPITAPTHAATPIQDVGTDSDEWEYEYSTTETETFLLTLDLTNPDLNSDRSRRLKKGPLRTRWINPGLGRNRPGKYTKPPTYSTVAGVLMEDAQPAEDDPEFDDEDEDEPENADKDKEESPFDDLKDEGEIQIVELHSNNPLITYNRHAYSCKWASNVGTELLFKAHDRDSTIPVLRKLNGGVDLLAVNQARIISDPMELQPRKRKRSPERAFVRGSHISHTKYLIPIGAHASAKRKDQAVFLERMIGMKAEKGELDSVTVVAEKRVSNNRWRPRVKELREKERKQLRKIINDASGNEGNLSVIESAKQRLKEMDEEDERVANMQPSLGKRRVAARLAHSKSKIKETDNANDAPNVTIEKPKRGRPAKSFHPAMLSSGAAPEDMEQAEGNADDEEDDEVVEEEERVEDAGSQTPAQNREQDAGDDIEDEDFYSARE